jgi:hypothetical protein
LVRALIAVLAFGAVGLPVAASAGQHTLTINKSGHNGTQTDIRFVKVIGATPETIPVPGKEGVTFTIEVTMPEGLCETRVSIITPRNRVDTRTNICANGSLTYHSGQVF